MEFTEIRLDLPGPDDDGIATLTLHRPDKLNAFTNMMVGELVAAFDRTDADDSVRSVIVTGAGRAFCAGADLSGGADTFDAERPDAPDRQADDGRPIARHADGRPVRRDGGGIVTTRIFRSLKPVIAAINGPAVGIGITMTLPMDFRLASTEARMGFVFTNRGIVTEAASSWFLPRLVGISQALEWTYTGRLFPAAEAHQHRLVRSLHAPDELLPAARQLAASFAPPSAVSIAVTRQLLWRMLGADHPMEAHKVDSRLMNDLGRGADAAEGVTSFLEKRPAAFPGQPSQDLPAAMPWWEERPFA
jgi:enoyl-CoA hydratase/carnithine racemase